MPRPISLQHYQALVANWRRTLVAVDWQTVGLANGVRRLVSLIGIDPREIDSGLRVRLRAAVRELQNAVASCRCIDQPNRPTDILDAWIARYLLQEGDKLLVPVGLRRGWLARQRDSVRRERHTAKGIQAKRIEMRVESWETLRRILPQLRRHPGENVSLGKGLERVIDTYVRLTKKTKPKETKTVSRAPPVVPGDLFSR
jgi:hypothetical protein